MTSNPSSRPTLSLGQAGAVFGFVSLGAIASAYLIAGGNAIVAIAMLIAVPGVVVLHRHPLVGVGIWLALGQLVVVGDGGAERKAYWVLHRALPVVVLVTIVLGASVGTHRRRLPRLGWPEVMMAGYLVASVVSVLYSSITVSESIYHIYDRIFIPMCLYMIVRLSNPGIVQLRKVMVALVAVLLFQSAIGAVSWVSPGLLPPAWLGRLGQRTIGSLGHPNVFGVTMVTVGLALLHASFSPNGGRFRRLQVVGFLVAMAMAFLTLGRANWLAATVAVAGMTVLYGRQMLKLATMFAPLVIVAIMMGALGTFGQMAVTRLKSEEAALSRLPVVYASLRMFEERPVVGWGFGNFDRFDRQFQVTIDDVITPEKDHASHNVYLTILAEQGLIGLGLFLGPALAWVIRSRRAARNMESDGLVSAKLVGVLTIVLAAHVVVNNFSNMKIVFGLGLWWLTLGLLAAVVSENTARPTVDSSAIRLPLSALVAIGARER